MSARMLHGWGGTAASRATLRRPGCLDDLRHTVTDDEARRGVIARGRGRSYGDAAQNAGGSVLDLTGLNEPPVLDLSTGTVRVTAGTTLDDLLTAVTARRRWLPVVPGTRQVSVGGAIAADVHGKNHHRDGSFGDHVLSVDLMVPSGDLLTIGPDGPEGELFWATVGGMGLTGVIVAATLRLDGPPSAVFRVDTERTPDLATLLTTLADHDAGYRYSVAWFDAGRSGPGMGRAVVTRGDHARPDELPGDVDPWELDRPRLGRVPLRPPVSAVNPATARVFNAVWYAKAPRWRRDDIQGLTEFFHPLDVVDDWNRLYGRRGLCQYQCVVPFGEEAALTELVGRLSSSGHVSALTVLKRFGDGNRGLLSFPRPGWTLAVDLPVRRGLGVLLSELDVLVTDAGGRLYLAKDSRAPAAMVVRSYPRLDRFRAVRAAIDPDRRFVSDLSRRLDL